MNRRDFLKCLALTTVGLSVMGVGTLRAEASIDLPEPPIYKRLLTFTEYEPRLSTEVIVIHHTGFPNVDKDSAAVDIHRYHQEVNGWAGIGYHYLIRKDGMIEQGRRPEMIGAHAYQHNKNSIGICLAGNFNIGDPTKAQLSSVKELVTWLCRKYNLNSMKDGVIVGHRDLNDTSCPGDNLYSELSKIRRAAQR